MIGGAGWLDTCPSPTAGGRFAFGAAVGGDAIVSTDVACDDGVSVGFVLFVADFLVDLALRFFPPCVAGLGVVPDTTWTPFTLLIGALDFWEAGLEATGVSRFESLAELGAVEEGKVELLAELIAASFAGGSGVCVTSVLPVSFALSGSIGLGLASICDEDRLG